MTLNKIKFNISLFAIALLLFQSCTETVDIDVPYEGDRLVIEASIDWERGSTGQTQSIKISTTSEYFAEQTERPVTGASVTITNDNNGTVFTFSDEGDGTYITDDFVPVLGQSYTLEVENNGQTYTAKETMIPVSNIISVEQTTDEGFSADDTEITLRYDDPANEDNYYMSHFMPSHKPIPTVWVFSDLFSDGNESLFFYEDEDFEPGVTVDITLLGISEQYYHYMNIIVTQSSQSISGPFQPSPVQLKGNITNANDEEEEVLGYFRLCEVIRTEFTIN